jgi:hypothetical protein
LASHGDPSHASGHPAGPALIKLDGGDGVSAAAHVIDAINRAVPVGAVMFGAESLTNAADFLARYEA